MVLDKVSTGKDILNSKEAQVARCSRQVSAYLTFLSIAITLKTQLESSFSR